MNRNRFFAALAALVMIIGIAPAFTQPASAATTKIKHGHSFTRQRDTGLVDHFVNLRWDHVKYPGTAPRYHWAKGVFLSGHVNLTGTGYDCTPDFLTSRMFYWYTRYSVHVWNNKTGRNWNRVVTVKCDPDTVSFSKVNRLDDTPRMPWRGGNNTVKIFVQDIYHNWWGDQMVDEHQFSGYLYHYNGE